MAGLIVILKLISVQLALNLPTGTEHGSERGRLTKWQLEGFRVYPIQEIWNENLT